MGFLLMIHSLVRWLIVITAVAAIVKFALGWLQGGSFQKIDRILASAFSGLLDLQVTLGIIYLIWDGVAKTGFPMFRIEHGFTMILAAVVGHLPARWKNAAGKSHFRNTLLCVLGALVLIYLGVVRLPGGWSR
jgi:hypothetical protein